MIEYTALQNIGREKDAEIDELKASNMKLEQELNSVKTVNTTNVTEIEDLTTANSDLKRTVTDLTIQLKVKADEQKR